MSSPVLRSEVWHFPSSPPDRFQLHNPIAVCCDFHRADQSIITALPIRQILCRIPHRPGVASIGSNGVLPTHPHKSDSFIRKLNLIKRNRHLVVMPKGHNLVHGTCPASGRGKYIISPRDEPAILFRV